MRSARTATKSTTPLKLSSSHIRNTASLPIVQRVLALLFLVLSIVLLSACSTTLAPIPETPKQEAAVPKEKAEIPTELVDVKPKADLPQIISFTSSHYSVAEPQKIRLEFVTNDAVEGLELSYNREIINVKERSNVEIDITQSTTFNLHALNTTGRQSSSISVRVGDSPFILQPQDVLRLRATDGNKQLNVGSKVPKGYELVVMGLNEIGSEQAQMLNILEQKGLETNPAVTTGSSLQTLASPESGHIQERNTAKPKTALFLEDNLAIQSQAIQPIQKCDYIVGKVCRFFVLAFDTKVNLTYLDIRPFKLVTKVNGMNFFVDEADLVSPNPDIEAISTETIEHLGKCTSTIFKRHFNKNFAKKTDIDNTGGVSFLLSNVLPYNGMVRWDDLDKTATGENNRADVAYLNTEHMRNLSPLSLATLYEEMFHAYHLGYRAASNLSRPNRFEAESIIGAVLDNIRRDEGISSVCGGGAKDTANSIEVAAGHFTLANIFLNKSHKRSLFGTETVSLQMAQYGIGRLLTSTMNHRDSKFIRKVITSKNTHHKTWSSLTDSTRVFEDAWLSLFLADSPDHAGYNLAKTHYTRLDTDYNILRTASSLSLNSLSTSGNTDATGIRGVRQTNESMIMLTGQPSIETNQLDAFVNINLEFDSGSVVVFLRKKN